MGYGVIGNTPHFDCDVVGSNPASPTSFKSLFNVKLIAVFDRKLIKKCVDLSYELLYNHSYTLDFEVLEDKYINKKRCLS